MTLSIWLHLSIFTELYIKFTRLKNYHCQFLNSHVRRANDLYQTSARKRIYNLSISHIQDWWIKGDKWSVRVQVFKIVQSQVCSKRCNKYWRIEHVCWNILNCHVYVLSQHNYLLVIVQEVEIKLIKLNVNDVFDINRLLIFTDDENALIK